MIFCHESFARRNLFVPLYSLGIVLFPPYGIALFGKQWCCHVSKFCLGMHWLPVQSRRLWGPWDLARSPSAQGSGSAARARLRHSEKPLWCLKEFRSSVSTPCSGFLPPHSPQEVCTAKWWGDFNQPGWGNKHWGRRLYWTFLSGFFKEREIEGALHSAPVRGGDRAAWHGGGGHLPCLWGCNRYPGFESCLWCQ